MNVQYVLEATFARIRGREGFGEKSYKKLIENIEKSKKVNLENFLSALGIIQVGGANAKLLVSSLDAKGDINKVINATFDELLAIDGFGEVISKNIVDYFKDEENMKVINRLLDVIEIEVIEKSADFDKLKGQVFVITGQLEHFSNRDEFIEKIESLGGKVTGSVSKKTNYLINNDKESTSSKNKKAKDLEIPIISEQDFLNMIML